MSQKGIKLTAEFFYTLERTKEELLRMGCEKASTKSGKQDILLAHMLRKAYDAIDDDWCKLTMSKME